MIEWLRTWLLSLIAATLVLTIFYGVLPKNPVRSVARSIGAIILVLVLLKPLLGAKFTNLKISFEDTRQRMDRQVQTYREDYQAQYEEIIAEQTAAYIQDRGIAYGISCQPMVDVRWQEEVPLPYSVHMGIQYISGLAEEISQQLGIPEERQFWEGGT